jgi:hypothetical protein
MTTRNELNAAVLYTNGAYWEVIAYDYRGNRVYYEDSNGNVIDKSAGVKVGA